MNYQPKTGQPCGCRRGVERDNCGTCEGTGSVIDFEAIRKLRPITLRSRSTWIDSNGRTVHIAGLTGREPVEGRPVWWSIQGDHYAADGRSVCYRRVSTPCGLPQVWECYLGDPRLVREVDDEESRAWWVGVVTSREEAATENAIIRAEMRAEGLTP